MKKTIKRLAQIAITTLALTTSCGQKTTPDTHTSLSSASTTTPTVTTAETNKNNPEELRKGLVENENNVKPEQNELKSICSATHKKGPKIQDETLNEISGLAISTQHKNTIWVHNDSDGKNELYAINTKTGETTSTLTIKNAKNIDWEDLAIEGTTIYIADTGNNLKTRNNVTIYKIKEPTTLKNQKIEAEKIEATWKTPKDVEALTVQNEQLTLITKHLDNTPAETYQLKEKTLTKTNEILMQGKTNFLADNIKYGNSITSADTLNDIIIIRTYAAIVAFQNENHCEATATLEPKGETIAITNGQYITISEGKNPTIHHYNF